MSVQCVVMRGSNVDMWAGRIIPTGSHQCEDKAAWEVTEHGSKFLTCDVHKRAWENNHQAPTHYEPLYEPVPPGVTDDEVAQAIDSIRKASHDRQA